jgi:dethiobiotin synthetase
MSVRAPIPGLFVVGTDTSVGKTQVASLILRELCRAGVRVGAYKPVCSGAIVNDQGHSRWEDIDRLREAGQLDCSDEAICPQRFFAPLAPPLAARAESRFVDERLLVDGADVWRGRCDFLVVEGAGGLLSPVSQSWSVADLASRLGSSLILVARCGLGTINHSLLTLEAARHRGLHVAGVILNQSAFADDWTLGADNAAEIERRGSVPVLGLMPWGSVDGLQRHGRPVTIPWQSLAGV